MPTSCGVPSLTLNKIVVNNNAGTSAESSWTLSATGPVVLSGPGAAGSTDVVSDGTFLPGTYALAETTGPAGYNSSLWTCTNGIAVNNAQITLGTGQTTVCSITNDDIVSPVVSSGGGGGGGFNPTFVTTSTIAPLIGITKIPTAVVLPNNSVAVTYDYTVWNIAKTTALAMVSVVDDKCTAVTFLSGDINNNNKLDINEIWKYNCKTTIMSTVTNTATAVGYSDDASHILTRASAVATVSVFSSVVPSFPKTGFPPRK